MNILNSNAIRGIVVVVIGMLIADLTTYSDVGDVDWRPTIIRYAVALLAALLRIFSVPVATTKDATKVG